MPGNRRGRATLIASIVACGGVIASASLASASGSSVNRTRAASGSITRALVEHFALLDRNAHSADRSDAVLADLAPSFRSHVAGLGETGSMGARLGLSQADTQIVQGPSGWQMAVVPGASGACIVASFPATSSNPADGAAVLTNCDTTANIMEYGLIATGTNDGAHFLVGLVPNGNQSVSVGTVGGAEMSAPVSTNTVMSTLGAAQAKTITLINGYGTTSAVPYTSPVRPPAPTEEGGQP
jgi:hypothetical protein